MPLVEFVGQSAKDASNPQANTGRLINLYREPVGAGGRTDFVLRSVYGVALFADITRPFVRAMAVIDGLVYVVGGGRLLSIDGNGVVSELGVVPDDEETSIAGNTGNVCIVAGGTYYVWTGTALTTPAMGNIDTATSVSYLGGYTILTGSNAVSDRLIQWSDLADPLTMPGLNFASAETTDEPIMRAVTINERLIVFKARGHETWMITGAAGANALALLVGSHSEIGLASYNAITLYPNGAALVSSDGRVSAWNGAGLVPISTPAVHTAIERDTAQRMFYYEARGHGFICVTFAGRPAWCYDVATLEWHERAEGLTISPWTARASAKFAGFWIVGYDSGKIGVFSPIPQEFGALLKRRAMSRLLWNTDRFRIAKAEIFGHVAHEDYPEEIQFLDDNGSFLGEQAYGYLGDAGQEQGPPTIAMRVTRDGVIFEHERIRDFGAVGVYNHRIVFRNLGQFRNFGAEVTMTAPVDTPINASIDLVVA